jgi:anti-anti-sigma factor
MPALTPPVALLIEMEERPDGTVVLALGGELDLATLPQLERRLLESEAKRPARILIDLHGLRFIDSSGLHALLSARQRAEEAGWELTLIRGSRAVQRLFELTGVDAMFSFAE